MNRSAALRCGSMESASRRAGSESGAATEFMAPQYASKVGGRSSPQSSKLWNLNFGKFKKSAIVAVVRPTPTSWVL